MIIWGWRSYIKTLGLVTFICGNCHNPVAQRVIRRITKFTLFFIPLFPVGSKYAVVCSFCGVSSRISKDEAENYVNVGSGQPGSGQPQQWGQRPAALQHGQPAYGQPGPDGQNGGPQGPGQHGQPNWTQQGQWGQQGQPQWGQQGQQGQPQWSQPQQTPPAPQQGQPQNGQQGHSPYGQPAPQSWQAPRD